MRTLLAIITLITVTGCAQLTDWIPSFWDDNQSSQIITVRQQIHQIDCGGDQGQQSREIKDSIQWFQLYSQSKGSLQKDVIKLVGPIESTVKDWHDRTLSERGSSQGYCQIKRRILIEQIDRAAAAVLGRY